MKWASALGLIIAIVASQSWAQNTVLYTGRASTEVAYLGMAFSSEVWDFLFFQTDLWKYLKKDQALAKDPLMANRTDFFGVSENIILKFPIHLIPGALGFRFIQPYAGAGLGFALDDLNVDHLFSGIGESSVGFFDRFRWYKSFGFGVNVMVADTFGFTADYRIIDIASNNALALPGRTIKRLSIGVCLGPYKNPKKTSPKK